MKPKNVFMKDPRETKFDRFFDWTQELEEGETIESYTLAIPAGLTKVSEARQDAIIYFRLSGGVIPDIYYIACQVTIAPSGRDPIGNMIIKMVDKAEAIG